MLFMQGSHLTSSVFLHLMLPCLTPDLVFWGLLAKVQGHSGENAAMCTGADLFFLATSHRSFPPNQHSSQV